MLTNQHLKRTSRSDFNIPLKAFYDDLSKTILPRKAGRECDIFIDLYE